jgi:hypothetical protein
MQPSSGGSGGPRAGALSKCPGRNQGFNEPVSVGTKSGRIQHETNCNIGGCSVHFRPFRSSDSGIEPCGLENN